MRVNICRLGSLGKAMRPSAPSSTADDSLAASREGMSGKEDGKCHIIGVYILLGVTIRIHSSFLKPKLLHPEPYVNFHDLCHSAYLDILTTSKSKELMHPSRFILKFVGKEILNF